jgi:cobalt-zinc-cadmium resistance protein CzcA
MISRLLTFSVEQRWLVVLLTFGAAIYGVFSLQKLAIDAVPDITNNQVQINTVAPSLSPIDVEKQITFPIETALAGIPGLDYTRSLSRNGFSQVTAVFSENTDTYFARQQVGERLRQAEENLPEGVTPKLGPISTGLGEIYMWTVKYAPREPGSEEVGKSGFQADGSYLTPEGESLTTEVERAAYLRTVQDWIIRPQMITVPGVAGIDVIGGFEKQYLVEPDPAHLTALNVSFSDVAQALEQNNVNRGAGYIERNGEGYAVLSTGRLASAEQISNVVVATRDGVAIRIKDVAKVSIGREVRTGSASENGEEVVVGTAMMLIGGNSRTVSAAVDAKMKQIQASLPKGVVVQTVLNRTLLVDATIATVSKNLAEGALLVILVLFLLLGNFRAALITAMVIPLAMLLTMTGMVYTKISANLMSLGALDFGLIVDGAVIIAENALRRIAEHQHELGRKLRLQERLRTVIQSSEEMIKPSVYGQAIIILVYVPLLTFSGIEGKMFEPMALTVIIALLAAFVLSLTFVPAAIAIAISGKVEEKENWLIRFLRRLYTPILFSALRLPLIFVGGAVALFALSTMLVSQLGQEFIPALDEKNIAMHAIRIPSTSLSQSQQMQLRLEKAVSRFPEVAFVYSKTGTAEVASDPMPPNVSDTFIILKPSAQWPDPDLGKDELIKKIQSAIEKQPGNNLVFSQPIQMRFNELLAGARGDLAVKIFGEEFEPMLRVANQVAGILRSTSGATDISVEQISGLPFLEIKLKQEEIARLGLSVQTIQDVIGAAIGGRNAGVVFEGDRRYPIVVRLSDNFRADVEKLKHLPVSLPPDRNGRMSSILLEQVAEFLFTEGPNQVSRDNGKRRVVVTANIRGRDIASVVAETQQKVATQLKLPAGYYISWGGQFENLAAAQQRMTIVVPACFFVIFLLLYSALGSARDAVIVFTAVPLALTGGILALWLRDMPFSISAAVGFIALSGVAVLNGLVMLTSINRLMQEGVSQRDAILKGASTRLRPVLMTALVASLGFVPMALSTGTGAEVQKPLATVVIGGLVSATILTLLVLPALCARFGGQMRKSRSDKDTQNGPQVIQDRHSYLRRS